MNYTMFIWFVLIIIFQIQNCEDLEKKVVLKIIMDAVYPNDFIPANYMVEEAYSSFLIKNCPGVIKQICQQQLMIRNPHNPEKPVWLEIILFGL